MHMHNQEYILCAAIWFDDGKEYLFQPLNIKTGKVFCALRHNVIYELIGGTVKERQDNGLFEKEQGFLTSENRFVNRNDGAKIARDANQINWTNVNWDTTLLYSEDLY